MIMIGKVRKVKGSGIARMVKWQMGLGITRGLEVGLRMEAMGVGRGRVGLGGGRQGQILWGRV